MIIVDNWSIADVDSRTSFHNKTQNVDQLFYVVDPNNLFLLNI